MADFTFPSHCRVIRKIGAGGMGAVFLAEQLGCCGFSKTVAIKTIKRELVSDKQFLDLFIGEARLVADLIHENIVQVYQLGEIKGTYFVIMEFVHGKDLDAFVRRHKELGRRVNPDMAAFIASRVARGLHYAHTKRDRQGRPLNVVHRDVTPGNILISYLGVVKLTDFGIAKALTMNTPDERKVIMGKIAYMSPEQAQFKETDPRSDLFALGLNLYEILAQERLFDYNDLGLLLEAHQKFRYAPVKLKNPEVPDALLAILNKLLAKDPADRFQAAWDVVLALEHFMYDKGYGPTNEKLRDYIRELFPEVNVDSVV